MCHSDEQKHTTSPSSRKRYTFSVVDLTGCTSFMLYRLSITGGGLGRLAIARFKAVSAASRYFSIRKLDV